MKSYIYIYIYIYIYCHPQTISLYNKSSVGWTRKMLQDRIAIHILSLSEGIYIYIYISVCIYVAGVLNSGREILHFS